MTRSSLVPLMRYRDVAAAIDWLSSAFGLEPRSVVRDDDGSVLYAELCFGSGVVMIGPVGQSGLDKLLKQPSDLNGANTQSCYVAVDDVEAHYTTAKAAGADIVLEYSGADGGDRAYAARDLEGHIWNFGAYAPQVPLAAVEIAPRELYQPATRLGMIAHSAVAACVITLAAGSAYGVATLPFEAPATAQYLQRQIAATAAPSAEPQPNEVARDPERTQPPKTLPADAASERRARLEAQERAAALGRALEAEAHARKEAARVTAKLREDLVKEQAARAAAEAASTAAKAQLVRERDAKLDLKSKSKEQDRARQEAIAKIEADETHPNAATSAPATTTGSLNKDPKTEPPDGSQITPVPKTVTIEPLPLPTPEAAADAAVEPAAAAPTESATGGAVPALSGTKAKSDAKAIRKAKQKSAQSKPQVQQPRRPKSSLVAPSDKFWPYDN